MASLDPITVPCPACGETITIPVSATPGDRRGDDSIEVHVGLDHDPIREHVEQHRTGGVMTVDQHTCPRRAETGRDNPDSPFHGSGINLDTWHTGGGLIGQEDAGLSCSYCGSLHPDRFMELVREGWIVEPTDKSYKAYLGKPLTAGEKTERKEKWLARFTDDEIVAGAQARGETPEQHRAGLAEFYDRDAHVNSAGMQAKFYFQHLSPEQRSEFIELHNSRRMAIGTPGYFYTRPFFTGPAAE
ncbi:hypothetical protein [Streptacidiphilus sp. EB129]|uniref:hypothetical protein n=1 Tax=Streptacidiphilus sp. EB129 TaxID=3156262 RepID=UPI003519AC43